jgi:ATP-dependent DNA helicase RecG
VARSRQEIQDFLNIKDRRHFNNRYLNPLVKGGLLKLTNPEKPTSPNQKYYSDVR